MKQREIKFRLTTEGICGYEKFDEENARWIYSKDGKSWSTDYIYHEEKWQYTGLLDRNGKEIYCGDILYKKYTDGSISKGEVFWGKSNQHNEEIETWCIKLETGIYWMDRSICEQYEVIGNIFENKTK